MLNKPTVYEKWLGIKGPDQPPTLYRLLGVEPLETDADIISHAADSRMTYLRQFQTGPNAKLSEEILNEVSHARVVLLNPDQKSAYDQRLRQQMLAERPVGSGTPIRSPPPVAYPLTTGQPVVPPRIATASRRQGHSNRFAALAGAANSPSPDEASFAMESALANVKKAQPTEKIQCATLGCDGRMQCRSRSRDRSHRLVFW